jgi:hypothetical protein
MKTALKSHKKVNGGNVVPEKAVPAHNDKEEANEDGTRKSHEALVLPADRPTHRLPVLGFLPLGRKVDTIDWATKEITETTAILEKERATLASENGQAGEKYPPLNSVFVLFNQQIGAHLAAQCLTHNEPYRMTGKHTEVAPADIIWSNLGK